VGYLYFEVRGNLGRFAEGGFQYNSDNSIQPYAQLSTSSQRVGLTNAGAHYMAGNQLALFHGVIDSGTMMFTAAGLAPSGASPETLYISQQSFQIVNAGWMFYPSTGDTSAPGTDLAGNFTPCANCSVSDVVSIGQSSTTTFDLDGSYFGVDINNGNNVIEWNQVGFGNFASDCAPGTTICTLLISPNPQIYYGGPQFYPDDFVSEVGFGPTGYGPYESFQGIDLGFDPFASVQRSPLGSFMEPLPPPPCGVDSYGYCVASISHGAGPESCITSDGTSEREIIGTNVYSIFISNGTLANYSVTYSDDGSGNCFTVWSWAPGEPSQVYGDPNLP